MLYSTLHSLLILQLKVCTFWIPFPFPIIYYDRDIEGRTTKDSEIHNAEWYDGNN